MKQFEKFPSKTNNEISSLLSTYTGFMAYWWLQIIYFYVDFKLDLVFSLFYCFGCSA